MSSYDITSDGKQVLFAAYDEQHVPHLWQAPVDRSQAPHQLFSETADQPQAAPGGIIYYRSRESGINQVYRYHPEGRREKLNFVVNEIYAASPDGKWVVVWAASPETNRTAYGALNTEDGRLVEICAFCTLAWSPDGRSVAVIYFEIASGNRSFLFPLKPGEDLPPVPPRGWQDVTDVPTTKARVVNEIVIPAPGGSNYAFLRRSTHRNLFRVPLN
jgi:hypothetical protein